MNRADKSWATRRARAALADALDDAVDRERGKVSRAATVAKRTRSLLACKQRDAHLAAYKRLMSLADDAREGRL